MSTDITITFRAQADGTYDLTVATDEGYNPRIERNIGPEEMLAVASLIDQFKGFQPRVVKELLRGTFRAQVQRAESDLQRAKQTAQSIPAKEAKLRELRKAVVA
jgi:hypothetical protein